MNQNIKLINDYLISNSTIAIDEKIDKL
jgi:hypothetical protein